MSHLEEFVARYRAGELLFITGAGVSRDSGAIMPAEILRASADIFLPPDPEHSQLVDAVLNGKAAEGASLPGIQPEIFYENLLSIVDDPGALVLWRVLSPDWLRTQDENLAPNPNHYALAQYSAQHSVPLFTMNFDMLFEEAAERLGIVPKVSVAQAIGVPVSTEGGSSARTMHLLKLHGSIMIDGEERLDSLGTTMQAISAVNEEILALLRTLTTRYTIAFVGYSGGDIDYFPVLAGEDLSERPFWFDPMRDPVTQGRANRIGARLIHELPSDVFATLDANLPQGRALQSTELLQALKPEVSLQLTPSQKLYFLALCLHGVGRNTAAQGVLHQLGPSANELPPENRAGALLLRSRVEDCVSEYWKSAETAQEALAVAKAAYRRKEIERAQFTGLRARALYHRGMARQQQIGPSIAYGDPRLDWRPGYVSMIRQLLSGVRLSFRLARSMRTLRRLQSSQRGVARIKAEHAINDHAIMLIGRMLTAAETLRLLSVPGVRRGLTSAVKRQLRNASATGDYFSFAHSHKYLSRLRAVDSSDQAVDVYALLRDPLNYAIVCRDVAADHLKRGEVQAAVDAFRLATRAALASGSRATALKGLIGLAACASLTEAETLTLAELAPQIEGAGYQGYWREKVGPFLVGQN